MKVASLYFANTLMGYRVILQKFDIAYDVNKKYLSDEQISYLKSVANLRETMYRTSSNTLTTKDEVDKSEGVSKYVELNSELCICNLLKYIKYGIDSLNTFKKDNTVYLIKDLSLSLGVILAEGISGGDYYVSEYSMYKSVSLDSFEGRKTISLRDIVQ